MPFYELRNGSTAEKQDVELTQLHSAPAGSNPHKTWFRVPDEYWWAPDAATPARSFESVPAAQVTDLASVPKFMWGVVASYGRHTLPALLHDWSCERASSSGGQRRWMRRQADRRFRQNLRRFASMGLVTRWMMWSAVRLFGFTPLGIVTGLATLLGYLLLLWKADGAESWSVFGFVATFNTAAWAEAGLAVILLGLTLWVSHEHASDGPDASVGPGFLSMLGAVMVGGACIGPLLPLIAITVVTNSLISVLNWVAYKLGVVFVGAWNALLGVLGSTPFVAAADLESIQAENAPEPPTFTFFPGP